jgi:hypothetical protein
MAEVHPEPRSWQPEPDPDTAPASVTEQLALELRRRREEARRFRSLTHDYPGGSLPE